MAKIKNIEDIDWITIKGPGNFEALRKPLTPTSDACNLGCSFYRLEAGKTAFPAHHHSGNDEAIYMLSGEMTLRLGEDKHTLKKGDYVTFPAGNGIAHQVSNPNSKPADFLCFSTMEKTDIVFYPDSGKVGIMAGTAPGDPEPDTWFEKGFMPYETVDYWQGEKS